MISLPEPPAADILGDGIGNRDSERIPTEDRSQYVLTLRFIKIFYRASPRMPQAFTQDCDVLKNKTF